MAGPRRWGPSHERDDGAGGLDREDHGRRVDVEAVQVVLLGDDQADLAEVELAGDPVDETEAGTGEAGRRPSEVDPPEMRAAVQEVRLLPGHLVREDDDLQHVARERPGRGDLAVHDQDLVGPGGRRCPRVRRGDRRRIAVLLQVLVGLGA